MYSKVCLYLYSPWNLIVPIKENLLFLLSSKKFRWTMNYIRSNYIIISTGVYNNTRCCFFFFFFYLYTRERTLNISRQCERNRKIARKAFLLSFVRSYQANRTKELFSPVSLSAADINATPRLSARSYRTTNVSTFWNASLWQSWSYQNEIIIQPEAIKWNRSKNNHFVMQFFLFIYIQIQKEEDYY